MVRRFSQNISQETFAEHEIWDPFSKLHPIHPYQQKAVVDTKAKPVGADTAAPPASTCKGTGTLHLHLNQRKNRKA